MPRTARTLLLAALGAAACAAEVAAQAPCPAGRIAQVVIRNHSIFDPETLPSEGSLLWAYELANTVHVRTREELIAQELLFRVGDCFDERRVRESARVLREFRFIAQADISVSEVPASGTASLDRIVEVRTRDEWSTKIALNVEFDRGLRFRGASLFEENLLGRGVTLGLYTVERGARRDVGGVLEVPTLRGSGWDAMLGASRTRGGGGAHLALIRPVRAELPGWAGRMRLAHDRSLFAWVLPPGYEFTHLTIPDLVQEVELSGLRRMGSPGRLYLVGGGLSYERVRIGGSEGIRGIRDGNFSESEPAGASMSAFLAPQLLERRALRLNAILGVRRLRFLSRRGLDSVAGVQDVPVGWEAMLTVGRSMGGTERGGPDDTFGRVAFLAGWSSDRLAGQVRVGVEGRRDDAAPSGFRHAQDVLAEGNATLYWLPRDGLVQSVVLRASVQGGWQTTAPFQLTLGGPEGLRGYDEDDFPGGRRSLVSAELRLARPASPFPRLFDAGLTLFGEVGAMGRGDAPYGVDSGWHGSLGAGLRLGFPAGTSSVIRLDLALPVGPGAGGRAPILRVSAREWIGILGSPANTRMDRSRRSGIRPEFTGAARDGTLP